MSEDELAAIANVWTAFLGRYVSTRDVAAMLIMARVAYRGPRHDRVNLLEVLNSIPKE